MAGDKPFSDMKDFQASYSCPGGLSFCPCHFHLFGTSLNQIAFIQKPKAEKTFGQLRLGVLGFGSNEK